MEEPDNAGDCAACIQKCLTASLRHLDELDLRQNGAGGLILSELMQGANYQFANVMDAALDSVAAFYVSIPKVKPEFSQREK